MIFAEGERLYLRGLTPEDAQGNYLRWMNDPEVTRFLESRYKPHTEASLRSYIEKISADPDYVFCAICTKDDHRHIGNIKLGPIDWNHRRAESGLLIGEKDCWGQTYAIEAYKIMARHAFFTLNLNKITTGAYAAHEASVKVCLRCGFIEEGRRRGHIFFEGEYSDLVVFGTLREEFERQEQITDDLDSVAVKI